MSPTILGGEGRVRRAVRPHPRAAAALRRRAGSHRRLGRALALVACLVLAGTLAPLVSAGAQQAPQPLYMLLTDDDILLADMTLQRALETALSDRTLTWRNAVSGNFGSVTPRRTYRTKGGFFCRVYAEAITVGGRSELYRDTACRDINGIWKPIR